MREREREREKERESSILTGIYEDKEKMFIKINEL